MFTRDHLESLARKELQALAKEHGVKANGSSDSIITNMLAISDADTFSKESQIATTEKIAPQEEVTDGELVEDKKIIALEKGCVAFGLVDSNWVEVIIKKVNKKSFRVVTNDNSEITLELDMVRIEKPEDGAETDMQVEPEIESVPIVEESTENKMGIVAQPASVEIASEINIDNAANVHVDTGKVNFGTTKAQKLRNEAIARNIIAASAAKEPARRPVSFADSSLITTPSKRKQFKHRHVDRNSFLMDSCTPFASKSRRTSVQEMARTSVTTARFSTSSVAEPKSRRNSMQETTVRTPKTLTPKALTPKALTPKVAILSKVLPKSPNFKAIHAKAFQNSKPITAVVAKNTSVDAKMTAALADAKAGISAVIAPTLSSVAVEIKPAAKPATKPTVNTKSNSSNSSSTGVVFGSRPRASTCIVKQGENVYGSNSFGSGSIEQKVLGVHANVGATQARVVKTPAALTTPTFKARPMPNFKAVHSKLGLTPTSVSASANKENSVNKRPVTTAGIPTTVKDTVTANLPEKNRTHRQSLFMGSTKNKRASIVDSRRAFC